MLLETNLSNLFFAERLTWHSASAEDGEND